MFADNSAAMGPSLDDELEACMGMFSGEGRRGHATFEVWLDHSFIIT